MEIEAECSTEVDWECDDEQFQSVQHVWEVGEAKEILAETPHEIQCISSETAQDQGLIQTPEDREENGPSLMSVDVDWERVRETDEIDLSIPVILVWSTKHEDMDRTPMVIDGHHRIAKAIDEGVEKLPAVLLTQEESDDIHVNLQEERPFM